MPSAVKVNVPFLDIKEQNRRIRADLDDALDGVISQAQFILGPPVERFERAFAAYVGRKQCVGLNNGTSALHMALQACDVGPGDEVITTPHTWISTSWAITYVGAKPVYVDFDPDTYNIDPALIERANGILDSTPRCSTSGCLIAHSTSGTVTCICSAKRSSGRRPRSSILSGATRSRSRESSLAIIWRATSARPSSSRSSTCDSPTLRSRLGLPSSESTSSMPAV
jgi:hypothetical protein